MLASAWIDGQRRAVIAEDDKIGITAIPGLDQAIKHHVDVGTRVERWVDASTVSLDAPLRPPVVFCLGQTYASHVAEKSLDVIPSDVIPKAPEFFLKAGQTIAAPGDPFVLNTAEFPKLDYESELGVVIGRTARRLSAKAALDHVFGYLVVNDLSDRSRQISINAGGGATVRPDLGKNFDGATVFSSYVQPVEAVPDPNRLTVSTALNGQLAQCDSTEALIFSVAELISYLSNVITLHPGAVIATGTPGGTGWSTDTALGGTGIAPPGCVPGRYLRAGDHVHSSVAGVGSADVDIIGA